MEKSLDQNQNQALTDKKYWSEYWKNQTPFSTPQNYFIDKYSKELLIPFNKYLSKKKNLSVLEIGGFPGHFLLDLARKYNFKKVGILDYCFSQPDIIVEKFKMEGYNLDVYEKDLFKDELLNVTPFDVVYSMGLVEHYHDIEKTTQKHLECLKKDGILIIGMPVFLGINKWLAKFFSPENFTTYYVHIMNDKLWKGLPEKLKIELLYSDYVGGFNPHVHHRLEKNSIIIKSFYILFHKLAKVWDKLPFTVKINSKYFSYYYYAVFKKN